MNILQRIGNRLGGGVTKNDLALVPGWKRHFLSLYDNFEDVINKAYKKNATVNACMWILQMMWPEPELWAWERGDNLKKYQPLVGHPLRKLMVRPMEGFGEVELLQYVITYAPLGGNVYLWKQRDQARRVKALWPFHDGQMTPIRGRSTKEGIVAYYVLDIGDNEQYNPWGLERFDENPGVAIPKSEMIHWKWQIDPQNPERGMGALVASAGEVNVGNEIQEYIYSFLKNDATPPLVMEAVEGDELNADKVKRLREQWKETFGGQNRGTPAFVQHGMKPHQLSFNLKDMEFSSLRDGPDTAICNGFHIHPAVVGTLAGLKYSSNTKVDEANKALALQTLVPLWRSFSSEMQQGLAGEIGYDEDITIRFDLAQVRALQESQTEIENRLGQMFDRGGITRGEYRDALGFESDEADEVYKENLASIWVPRGTLREYDPELLENEGNRQGTEDEDVPSGKSGIRYQVSGRKSSERVGLMLQKIRGRLVRKFGDELERYFTKLANDVVERVSVDSGQMGVGSRGVGSKGVPLVTELITETDEKALETLLTRFYVEVVKMSWDTWNAALGVDVAFDLNDPVVTGMLANAAGEVKDITATTKAALQEALAYGHEQGWGIGEYIRGDAEAGIRGIREIVDETYKGRAENIARDQLGKAQNQASVLRYKGAGVEQVLVLDDGFDNSDENCIWLAGQVRSLEWTLENHPNEGPSGIKNPLQHPRCVRCFAPYFGE